MNGDLQGTKQTPKRYQFVARTLIFIYRETKVLLLRGAPDKRLWANRYNGIGGHVEQSESIFEAAVREIQEETGITTIENLRLTGIITIDTNTSHGILLFIFTASTEESRVLPSDEGTPEWVDWHNLPVKSMMEDLPVLLTKLEVIEPSDPPFHAHYSYNESGALSIRFANE